MAKALPNTLLADVPRRSGEEHQRPYSVWLTELYRLATAFLVFIGAAAMSRWIWPNRANVSRIVALLCMVGWILAGIKLRMQPPRHLNTSGWRGLVIERLVDFIFFSSFWFAADTMWDHTPTPFNVINSCVFGVLLSFFGGVSRS